MNYTSENTLSEIVQGNMKAAFIFRNYNLNFSTEGRKTLKEACSFAGIKPDTILNDLRNLREKYSDYVKVNDWKIDFLCDYIEVNHHKYIRQMMPKILSLGKILCRKDLIEPGLLIKLQTLGNDFEIHMQKEEKLIFPYIKKMNAMLNVKSGYEIPPFGSIANPVKVVEKEHSAAGNSLTQIKAMCGGYKINSKIENNKKTFYEYLKEFDTDFHFHIHFENNILFPKSISMEKKLKKLFFNNINNKN